MIIVLHVQHVVDTCDLFACSIAAGIDENCSDQESVAGHLLLFISALIPKAVASLLTSAVIELSKPENVTMIHLKVLVV